MNQMVSIALISLATLLLLIAAFVGLFVVHWAANKYSGRLFYWLLMATAIISILKIIMSGRVLRLGDTGLEILQEGDLAGTLSSKALLIILIGSAFSICITWWIQRFGGKQPVSRYTKIALAELNKLTWAFVVYYLAFSILPLIFAPRFAFHISLIYPFFLWLALFVTIRVSTIDPVLVMRQALGLFVLSSLIAAILIPSLTLQPGYRGLIPGFTMRLWGTAAHANGLGSIAGILLIMQFIDKPKNMLSHYFLTISAATALFLTQSKSAIGGAVFGLSIIFFWRIWRGKGDRVQSKGMRILFGSTLLAFTLALLLVSLWMFLSDPSLMHRVEQRFDPTAIASASELTGRIDIWKFAIRRGLENPWFGNGYSMWDLQTRLQTGLTGAVHAHNLYLQTFSRSGMVGVVALLILLLLIFRHAIGAATVTGGGSLAILAMFLIRTVTEVPLAPNGILGPEFFSFWAVLVCLTDRYLMARGMTRKKEAISLPNTVYSR